MFTVTIGRDGSGKSSTRSPFGRAYSVIPSREVIRCTPLGSGTAAVEGSAQAGVTARNRRAKSQQSVARAFMGKRSWRNGGRRPAPQVLTVRAPKELFIY